MSWQKSQHFESWTR